MMNVKEHTLDAACGGGGLGASAFHDPGSALEGLTGIYSTVDFKVYGFKVSVMQCLMQCLIKFGSQLHLPKPALRWFIAAWSMSRMLLHTQRVLRRKIAVALRTPLHELCTHIVPRLTNVDTPVWCTVLGFLPAQPAVALQEVAHSEVMLM